ncbi:MAG: hypothetical protein AAF670_18165 [Planctomycetota bacterium]
MSSNPDGRQDGRSEASSLGSAAIPRMGAEAGFEVVRDEELAPLRLSGFVCCLMGLLSFVATVAYPMMIIPMIAIAMGCIALRRSDGPTPVGTRAAMLGMLLASGFGACGIAIHHLKQRTLGRQAEHFARQYIQLAETGDVPLSLELQKHSKNRQMKEADIDAVYSTDEAIQERVEEFSTGLISQLQQTAGTTQWELAKPVRVYQQYGNEKADTLWEDASGTIKQTLEIQMQWNPSRDEDTADWQVSLFQWYRERIVAPTVL